MDSVHEHGTLVNRRKQRVRCNYCNKDMRGFTRLKHHLACIRGDVTPCQEVSVDVKLQMGSLVLNNDVGKRDARKRDARKPERRNTSVKRNLSVSSMKPSSTGCIANEGDADKRTHKVTGIIKTEILAGKTSNPAPTTENEMPCKKKTDEDSRAHACRCIGRFFYDSGIDFGAVNSPYFKSMVDAIAASGAGWCPSSSDLREWILSEELKSINQYLKDVKSSWDTTGCSILYDNWIDDKGRILICFMVDSPRGTVFLKSIDPSNYYVDDLVEVFSGIIEEVGVQNVVQIIACKVTDYMENVREKVITKHKSLFWNHCAVYCLDRMLEEGGILVNSKEVLHNAKFITSFLYSDAHILALMKRHTCGRELVTPAKTESTTNILTLQNIVSEKENLRNMFSSPIWNSSSWSSDVIGKEVSGLIWNPSFWAGAEEVLKVTIPLLRILKLIHGDEKYPIGYIYEAIDRAKETIRVDLNYDEKKYLPVWNVVDEIWNKLLHSPLHAAGYYLNPSYFYSDDFCGDAEVAVGLLYCIDCMVKDLKVQNLLHLQLDEYRKAKGGFSTEKAIEGRTKCHPVAWWSLYGSHCPELQVFAIRILSQTCSGVRCEQNRNLLEQQYVKGRSKLENSLLEDLAFVHYNLSVQRPLSIIDINVDPVLSKGNPWVRNWIAGTLSGKYVEDRPMDYEGDIVTSG